MKRALGLIAAAAVTALALAGCASTGEPAPAGSPTTAASVYTAPSAAPSTGPCTTHACIASDAEQLKGTVAKDNSVMTKVTCRKSTVRQVVPGTYTVHCTIWYSDGAEWRGIASVLTAKGDIEWEPTGVVSYGSGG